MKKFYAFLLIQLVGIYALDDSSEKYEDSRTLKFSDAELIWVREWKTGSAMGKAIFDILFMKKNYKQSLLFGPKNCATFDLKIAFQF